MRKRLRRVTLEAEELRRAGVSDEQARDQVGLRGVGCPERQPEPEHREQAARDEEHSGDDEQDQRRAVAVARSDAQRVHERARGAGDLLVVQQVDQGVDEHERERIERGDHDAVQGNPPQALPFVRLDERPRSADSPNQSRRAQYAPLPPFSIAGTVPHISRRSCQSDQFVTYR